MTVANKRAAGFAAAALALTAGVVAWATSPDSKGKPPVGLFTSLPIFWAESDSIGEALDGAAGTHWVRTAIEDDYRPVALDTVDKEALAGLDRLVMAQPRPLSPAENVALDAWVRGGGMLLLFADPMLTEHSRFAIGDRRRPQDVVLLSPILRHWGLELQFDEEDESSEGAREALGTTIAVNMPGRLVASPASPCTLEADGLVAECRLDKGRVTIVADAAMLESDRVEDGAPEAMDAVIAHAFR